MAIVLAVHGGSLVTTPTSGGNLDTVAGIPPDEDKDIPVDELADALVATGKFASGSGGSYTPPPYNSANVDF